MKFHINAIESALAVHVSEALAARLRVAAAVALGSPLKGDHELTFEEIGEALALGLCTVDPKHSAEAVSGLALKCVQLTGPHGRALFEPDEAQAHPLFTTWLRPTFGGAIGSVVRSGALMLNLAPGAPLFENIALTESEGAVVNGCIRVVIGEEARAELMFGPPADPPRLLVHKSIGGDALFGVGVALRESRSAYPDAIAAVDAAEAVRVH